MNCLFIYLKKLKEYKEKQAELEAKMQSYTDEKFYLTANTVLKLAQKAYEIFQSSEAVEKRQLLNFLLQNLQLKDGKLMFTMKTPFDTVLQAPKYLDLSAMWARNLLPQKSVKKR